MDRKIILVTGASSGIGEAVARRLAAERHTVVLTGRNRKKLESMEREMASGGLRVVAIHGDLSREEDVRFIVGEALKTFGNIQALVHSAGIFRINRVEETSSDEFRQVMDTNLTSMYYLAKQIMPHFYRQGGGHVVAISSVAARQGFSGETAYCASKWGLMGFLEALRLEGAERGVRVTAVLPGPTRTPAWDLFKGSVLKERMISAESVADAVIYALSQPESTSVREVVVTPARDPFGAAGRE